MVESKNNKQQFEAQRYLFLAPSQYGKSHLISEHVLQLLEDKVYSPKRILIFSPTFRTDSSQLKLIDYCQKKYKDFIEENCYEHLDGNEGVLETLYDIQKNIKEMTPKKLKPWLLIFDDVISEGALKKKNILQKIATTGRHFWISSILSLQAYRSSMNTIVRSQMSCVCIGRLLSVSEVEDLCEQYSQGFGNNKRQSKEAMIKVWEESIQKNNHHGFLIIWPYRQYGQKRIQIGDFNGPYFD